MKFKALLLAFTFLWNVNLVYADEGNKDISFYTGTFDLIDKESWQNLLQNSIVNPPFRIIKCWCRI